MMKILSEITLAQLEDRSVLDAVRWYICYMVAATVALFFGKAFSVSLFSKVGQNIVYGVR